MPQLPTLVFVHGSWHKPVCYGKITAILHSKHRLKCVAITLPSTMGNPLATFKDDVDVVRGAIASETTEGRDVIVVAHSYGGMVGNSAIKDFTQDRAITFHDGTSEIVQSSLSTGGQVIGLVLIASGFSLSGLCFMDPFFGRPPASWRVNKETGYADLVTPPQQLFYHDLSLEEADYWTSQLTTQSLKSLFEGGEFVYAGWMDVPVWYIGTIEDQGLPVVVQRMAVAMARELGGNIVHRELKTSHSPFLSQPEETVSIIIEAIDAFMPTSMQKLSTESQQCSGVPLPEITFWQPMTWFKYGLPFAFGHVLGRCIKMFTWSRKLFRC